MGRKRSEFDEEQFEDAVEQLFDEAADSYWLVGGKTPFSGRVGFYAVEVVSAADLDGEAGFAATPEATARRQAKIRRKLDRIASAHPSGRWFVVGFMLDYATHMVEYPLRYSYDWQVVRTANLTDSQARRAATYAMRPAPLVRRARGKGLHCQTCRSLGRRDIYDEIEG